MPCAVGGIFLAHHRHQRTFVNSDASASIVSFPVLWGHLSRTPSAPARARFVRMPGPASAQALCFRGIWLAQHRHQRDIGAPRFLQQSTIMLVLLGAPVWHTIGTGGALLRADAPSSIGSCLVCLMAPGLHSLGTGGTLVRQGASSSLGTCLCF